jgi:1-acyl-sn-glycerol-3-phosphate acyltransferase
MLTLKDSQALAERFRREGSYRSSPDTVRRWRGFAGIRYYTRLMAIYMASARIARQGKYTLEQYTLASHRILQLVESLGGEVDVQGLANLTGPGPAVIISNHMSSLETGMLPGLILPFRDVGFVIKTSLLTYPIFGEIMRSVKNIAVSRTHPREDLRQVLEQGTQLLKQGVNVAIFPQATRSVEFDTGGFNSLGVKLAARAGVPVIPLVLKTNFQENGTRLKDFGRIDPREATRYYFGAPLAVEGPGRSTQEQVVAHILKHLREWQIPIKSGEVKP